MAMAQPHTQAMDRTDLVVEDQFGRGWLYTFENKTMDPTGLIEPAGWADPMRTPQKYLRVPKNRFGRPEIGRMVVDFRQWAADQREADNEWTMNLWNIGQDAYKGARSVRELEGDAYVLHLAGPKPWPRPEVIDQAAAGHEGLLGIVPIQVDGQPNDAAEAVEARELLGLVVAEDLQRAPTPPPPPSAAAYFEFMAEQLKAGRTHAQATAAWKERVKAQGEPKGAATKED